MVFGLNLHNELMQRNPTASNTVVCPLGVVIASLILKLGASGKAAEEILTALGLDCFSSETNIDSLVHALRKGLLHRASKSAVDLKIASRMFAADRYLANNFIADAKALYHADTERVNFLYVSFSS